MKINNIVNIDFENRNNNIRHKALVSNISFEEVSSPLKQKVFSNNITFGNSTMLRALVNDYKWFINNDKTPAVRAFLKINAPKESMEGLLRYILSNDSTSYDFINSIVENPRQSSNLYFEIKDKLPAYSELTNFYSPQNPYTQAYERYMDSRVQNAKSVSELLKIRPDWKEEVLLNKHRELYHNNDFELGTVPESIGKENFEPLIQYLRNFSDYGFKMVKNIEDFSINGRRFRVNNFIDGKSDKNVFEVIAENGKKYIIKLGRAEGKSLNAPFSLGVCCLIDTYLTRNNCRNSAPLRYYNHNQNVAIYDYINHSITPKMTQLQKFVARMPDFSDLGLTHNDTVGDNNYFLLDDSQTAMKSTYDFDYGVNHNELISVDNDHVTYNQNLHPMINKYHAFLPCEMQMFF